jgi:hypothetical protein
MNIELLSKIFPVAVPSDLIGSNLCRYPSDEEACRCVEVFSGMRWIEVDSDFWWERDSAILYLSDRAICYLIPSVIAATTQPRHGMETAVRYLVKDWAQFRIESCDGAERWRYLSDFQKGAIAFWLTSYTSEGDPLRYLRDSLPLAIEFLSGYAPSAEIE